MFCDAMTFLRKRCLETIGYRGLAVHLQCSQAQVARFFANDNPTLSQVYRVVDALACALTITIRPQDKINHEGPEARC